jgi:hypothetical protein
MVFYRNSFVNGATLKLAKLFGSENEEKSIVFFSREKSIRLKREE